MGKSVAYVRLFDDTLPLQPTEVELENNKCCLDSKVEFTFGKEIGYFNA